MSAISEEPDRIKVVHTYGVGLHGGEPDPDFGDPGWQQRQVLDFVDFTVEAEQLGFDGITVTEHHTIPCPSPHLLLAAAATRTSRIRLGTAVTVLPLYSPIRVAEEAGTLDLLSGGWFELGLGRGVPGEVELTIGRVLTEDELMRRWVEIRSLLHSPPLFEFIEQGGTFPDVGTQRSFPTSHCLNVLGPLRVSRPGRDAE